MLEYAIQWNMATENDDSCIISKAEDTNVRKRRLISQQIFRPADPLLGPCVSTMTSQTMHKNDTNWSQKLDVSVGDRNHDTHSATVGLLPSERIS